MVLKALLPKLLLAALPLLFYACAELPPQRSSSPAQTSQPSRARVQQEPSSPTSAAANPAPSYAPAAPMVYAPPSAAVPREVAPPAGHGGDIALLLPLTGQFSATAEAVRDGFMSAYFASSQRPRVRLYDVGGGGDALRIAYQRALSDGAGIIVGPLTKEGVTTLASFGSPVPVLGLNYVDTSLAVPGNFFQFGLAPEDEARAAAQAALQQGQRRALVLIPDNDSGLRTLAAFDATLRAGGGQVVRAQRYTPGVNDQSRLIADLMGVSASEDRHRALMAVLGGKSEFESQRRGDVDLLFLSARAQDARLLIPQLRFNRGGDLPVYSTALVYDGKPAPDLNGLRFCDAPWMIDASAPRTAQRAAVVDLGSARASPRLFALGRDAYSVAIGLLAGSLRVGDSLEGATGHLDWQARGVIGRQLGCTQISGDSLRPLGP